MMLSTKARRVSVGARAGNARRSALRRGCGERFRTRAGKAWPIARGRGPGEPGTHARGAGKPTPGNSVPKDVLPTPEDAEAPTLGAFPVPGNRESSDSDAGGLTSPGGGDARPGGDPLGPKVGSTPEARAGSFPEGRGKADARKFGSGNGLAARSVRDAAAENSAATGPKAVRRKIPPCSVSRPRRPRETTRTSSVQSRPRATGGSVSSRLRRGPAFSAGLGPANGIAAGLGGALRLRECRRAGPALFRGNRERSRPRCRKARVGRGLETPRPGQPPQRTAARRAARKESKPTQKRRSRLPCPGTFRKRNTLP